MFFNLAETSAKADETPGGLYIPICGASPRWGNTLRFYAEYPSNGEELNAHEFDTPRTEDVQQLLDLGPLLNEVLAEIKKSS